MPQQREPSAQRPRSGGGAREGAGGQSPDLRSDRERPLPNRAVAADATAVGDRHAGLWFDKYCDQWCRDQSKSRVSAWTLKAFERGRGRDKEKIQPKLEWLDQFRDKSKHELTVGDADALTAYATRLANLATARGGKTLPFTTAGRFVTGLGRSHPVENGFAWHPTLGTPYLPASSIKGMVRGYVQQWLDDDAVENAIVTHDVKAATATDAAQRARALADYFFGGSGDAPGVGRVIFLDAVPTQPPTLAADIMTPHYGPYYSDGQAPGDWHSPNPIPFLTVRQGATFQFAILPRTPANQPLLTAVSQWLQDALDWIGAGAKTAVGYGRFLVDDSAQRAADRARDDEKRKREDETQRIREQEESDRYAAELARIRLLPPQQRWFQEIPLMTETQLLQGVRDLLWKKDNTPNLPQERSDDEEAFAAALRESDVYRYWKEHQQPRCTDPNNPVPSDKRFTRAYVDPAAPRPADDAIGRVIAAITLPEQLPSAIERAKREEWPVDRHQELLKVVNKLVRGRGNKTVKPTYNKYVRDLR